MTFPRVQAVIMAGGAGKRFWPRSRRALPKQFLRIGGPRTLLRETLERVLPLTGPQGVAVVTGREHVDLVRKELPEVPAERILGEPVARDTAACVGLAAEWLRARGSGDGEVLLVCPSDHLIRPAGLFEEAVRCAAAVAAASEVLVTFGIPPRGPSPAFGYVERGARLGGSGAIPVHGVKRFVEKPARPQAEEYLRRGGYYWNSGIFVFTLGFIRGALARFLPQLWQGLEPLGRRLRNGDPLDRVLGEEFPSLAKSSLDRGVLEAAAAQGLVAVVEAPFEWDDLGSWDSLARYLPADRDGNHVEGRHLGLDTAGCIVAGSGRRLIGTIGLRDLVIVETDDAILVCPRDQVEKVKELVDRLEQSGEGGRA